VSEVKIYVEECCEMVRVVNSRGAGLHIPVDEALEIAQLISKKAWEIKLREFESDIKKAIASQEDKE